MPVIQAQDIVNAVIQDSQQQTTNRTALYDYTDRIHQRILRESKWRFLLSDPKTFATLPGVSSYTLVSGSAPAGSFLTNLGLTDFYNIAPGSVYNTTLWSKIEEDPDEDTTLSTIINQDGSLRTGIPRTYANSLSNPGTIFLKPAPDGNNLYYPVPETPVVTFSAGGSLTSRVYYGVVTFVDSLGGESKQCTVPFTIAVPAGFIVTVSSPLPPPGGGIAGNQAAYSSWNLYMGLAVNAYFAQNITPIPLGTSWVEPVTGAYMGALPVPSTLNLPVSAQLAIASNGILETITSGTPLPVFNWALIDSNNHWWEIIVVSGFITTTSISPSPSTVKGTTAIYLTDQGNVSTWAVTVATNGLLQTTRVSTPPTTQFVYAQPPSSPTIQPLNAYIIQFRYYKQRNQITSPTDVLQIPYAYKDIVIAGVNYLASLYMDIQANREPSAKTIIWRKDFDLGLSQIRRDLRINYRKTDYIAPDRATQYVVGNQQGIPTMGW